MVYMTETLTDVTLECSLVDLLVRRLGLGWVMLMGWVKESLLGYLWVE